MWDFTKIPDFEWESIIKAYDQKKYVELIRIHNRYQLSEYDYCCGDNRGLIKWFKKGIAWSKDRI